MIPMRTPLTICLLASLTLASPALAQSSDIFDRVTHGYVDNDGVRLHYATLGEGPLVVMLHGFPDFWYTWHHQMLALAEQYRVVAFDLRGYNLSDKPSGVENYTFGPLLRDVAAVIDHFGEERAILVGNDWGGAISWVFAMNFPHRVERLIICNIPHPNGLAREFQRNEAQQQNSQYAIDFQAEDAHTRLTPAGLAATAARPGDPVEYQYYLTAMENSDIEAMLNYYKASFINRRGNASNASPSAGPPPPSPQVQAPTLVIHGLADQTLLASGLNDTWEWIDAELTIITLPGAGHFVQREAPERVTRAMQAWLARTAANDAGHP